MTESNIFLHWSETKLQIGTNLVPRGYPYVDKNVEGILKKHKPPDCLDRESSIFCIETEYSKVLGLKYSSGFLHCVKAIGHYEKRDLSWVGKLQVKYHSSQYIIKEIECTDEEITKKYWAGCPSKSPNWEIIVQKATVIGFKYPDIRPIRQEYGLINALDPK